MPKTLIASNPTFTKEAFVPNVPELKTGLKLNVAEFFCDTIQGEGVTAGVPSTFLRLQGCTLECVWCDTLSVWKYGNPYHPEELFLMMEQVGLIKRLEEGQHLILTGGSPLKQQAQLTVFLALFEQFYGFLPYIEVENEAVLMPSEEFIRYVDQWNNSPKLANSGMKLRARYKPEILKFMNSIQHNGERISWFKFVVESQACWDEIQKDFIDTGLISKDQIILMPCGENQELLTITRPIAADLAIANQVRFSDRLHVTIWDKKTGV